MVFPYAEPQVTFTKPLKDKTVKEEETVTLECELSRPGVPVEWLKDGVAFKPDENAEVTVEGTVHRLTLKKANVADAGAFTVKIPDAETSAKLTVQGNS